MATPPNHTRGAESPQQVHEDFDIDNVLLELTLDEKISLISGSDPWHTSAIPRLKVPKIRVTDGPNGVRGTRFFNGVPAACFPCGTALAATWDTELVQNGGTLQGREAIAKGASVILGPTTNMQRSPLGGRGFESFSEDPVLAGEMSAATIRGIQSTGVAATLKHFVCNDQEHERQSVNAIVSEQALREIYLLPFQIAQRDSKPLAYMTAYNKVNGTHASEHTGLIDGVLRKEWGFDGLVMSDWFGLYSTTEAIQAGLDLEMPGPTYIRGGLVKQALSSGRLLTFELDQRVREVLKLVKRLFPLGIPEDAEELTIDTPETSSVLRSVASSGLVLLKNTNSVLPFKKEKTTAVIGPNADFAAYCGGGSASLKPYYAITPLEGVKKQVPDVKYKLGAAGWKKLPLLSRLTKAKNGLAGFDMKLYLEPPSVQNREAVDSLYIDTSDIFLDDYKNAKIKSNLFYLELCGTFTAPETAEYEFSLSVSGTGKLFVDEQCVVDNETTQTHGDSFFGSGTVEEIGSIKLSKDRAYRIHITFGTLPTRTFEVSGSNSLSAGGLRAGGTPKIHLKTELNSAVALAKSVDQVILCAGLNGDWESEGYDRSSMDLPPGTNELIQAVVEANPNTAVVIQSGTPVAMPWVDDVPALIQAWYGGNETGNAIADIVFGSTNPSGKLPLSFPCSNEDNPAFLNYLSEHGRTIYGEGVYIGYRFYEKCKREVTFPFGHGLSYTTFHLDSLTLQDDDNNDTISHTLTIRNTGPMDGAEVIQVYIAQHKPSINRPVKELKAFKKVFVQAEQTERVTIKVSKKYATSFWDEQRHAWVQERGKFTALVGNSSANTPLKAEFEVEHTRWWNGL
ncbi:putative beta-glucosidase I [Aspergillus karnatakaensis]|uniref:beta-glucosidase H n=1 Tax=Aspergillus karnatakaensis TaxID=1810916 RepID=UPI003CCCF17A